MSLPPWLEPLRARFAASLAAGALPHALLIDSPGGWGEHVLGATLAADALGVESVDGLAHPDFRLVAPDGDFIKVDDVRALNEFVIGTRQMAARKVVLITAAHAMNLQAANAFLKRLEEPPAGTHMILVAVGVRRLQPTIVSRCQRMPIRGARRDGVRQWLEAQGGTDVDAHLDELGGAPYAVLDACSAGEAPLGPALASGDSARIGEALASQDPDRAVCRWLQCVRMMLAGETAGGAPHHLPERRLHAFAEDLLWVRRQLAMAGTNSQALLERALLEWSTLAA